MLDRVPPRVRRLAASPWFWFAVALVVRLLYMLEQAGTSPLFYQPLLDEREAVEGAQALLKGTSGAAGGVEPWFKSPGYTWILAAVMGLSGGAWPWVIRIVQHLAGAYLVRLVAQLTGGLTAPPALRGIAVACCGFIAALYAPMIRLEENLSLDFWVVFFQTLMLHQLIMAAGLNPRRHALWAGLWAAAAWLTRPTITVALPFLAVWLFLIWRRRPGGGGAAQRMVMPVLFLLPVCLAAVGVTWRNAHVAGEAMALPWQGGYNFYYANRPAANGRYLLQSSVVNTDDANPTHYLAIMGYKGQLSAPEKAEFEQRPRYGDVNRYWFNKGVRAISMAPDKWAELMGKKALYLFSDKEIFNYEDYDLQRELSPLLGWLPGRFGIAFPLAVASLALWPVMARRRRWVHGLVWVYVGALGVGIALYYVSGRMRMPLAMPMLALAGCGAAGLLTLPPRRRALAIALATGAVLISWNDWWGVRSESMAYADLARLSNAAWHQGKYEDALDYAQRAEKLAPDYAALPRLKAQAHYSLGDLELAREGFAVSVRVLGDETSRRNLAVVEQDIQERDGATSPTSQRR